MPIIRLDKLLASGASGTLDKIIRTAQQMDELTTVLKKELKDELATHLLAASINEKGELVLVASSSAWATRFRFEPEKLLGIARSTGATISTLRVIVSKR